MQMWYDLKEEEAAEKKKWHDLKEEEDDEKRDIAFHSTPNINLSSGRR